MVPSFRQLTLDLASKSVMDRRSEARTRTETISARLSDLYRERIPVSVLNVSASGMGVKVEDRFAIGFPVLLECDGLLVLGNVRHCIQVLGGGFLLGLKVQRVVELTNIGVRCAGV